MELPAIPPNYEYARINGGKLQIVVGPLTEWLDYDDKGVCEVERYLARCGLEVAWLKEAERLSGKDFSWSGWDYCDHLEAMECYRNARAWRQLSEQER